MAEQICCSKKKISCGRSFLPNFLLVQKMLVKFVFRVILFFCQNNLWSEFCSSGGRFFQAKFCCEVRSNHRQSDIQKYVIDRGARLQKLYLKENLWINQIKKSGNTCPKSVLTEKPRHHRGNGSR